MLIHIRSVKKGDPGGKNRVIPVYECPFATTHDPVLDYLRCPTAVSALPNDTYRAYFHRLKGIQNTVFSQKRPIITCVLPLFLEAWKTVLSRYADPFDQNVTKERIPITNLLSGKSGAQSYQAQEIFRKKPRQVFENIYFCQVFMLKE